MEYREMVPGDDVWHRTFGNGFVADVKQDGYGIYSQFIVVFKHHGERKVSRSSLFHGHTVEAAK